VDEKQIGTIVYTLGRALDEIQAGAFARRELNMGRGRNRGDSP
jgi:hypothetical protein